MGHETTRRDPPRERPAAPDLRALEDPKTHQGLRRYVRAILIRIGAPENELEDLVAEVVGEASTTRHRYDPARATMATWLESIARHKLIDLQRRRGARGAKHARRVSEEEAEQLPEPVSHCLNPEQAVHARQLLVMLESAVTGRARATFLLHAEGYSRPEIAAQIGVPESTVKQRLERAGELRDEAAGKLGEDRRSGADVRFGVLPLLLAQEEHNVVPAAPNRCDDAPARTDMMLSRGFSPANIPSARFSPRGLAAKVAAASVLTLASALTVANGPGEPPRGLHSSAPLPDTGIAASGLSSPPLDRTGVSVVRAAAAVRRGPLAPPPSELPTVEPPRRPPQTGPLASPEGSDVLLRLAGGAARAGAHDSAASLLDRHARQLPSTEPALQAALARAVREGRAAGTPRR